MKFKVGDKVKFVGIISDIPIGSLGTVTSACVDDYFPYEVDFYFYESIFDWPMNEDELDYAT